MSVGAEVQKQGKYVIYVMGEPPFPQQVADEVGLVRELTIVLNPLDFGEQLADAIYEFLYDPETRAANAEIGLVIWDSIDTIVPKSAIDRQEEKGSEAAGMAERPRLLADFLGKLLGRGMLRAKTIVIMIAQMRTALGDYGVPTKASGGNALKFDCKVLMNLRKKYLTKTRVDDYQVYAGHDIICEIEKNNVDRKPTTVKYTYVPGVGIDDSLSLFNRGLEEGYISMAGRANYLFEIPGFEPVTVAKKADAQAYLKQDKERRDALRAALRTPKKKATRVVEAVAVDSGEPVVQTIDEQDNE
jgi:RecA/RadA recombinase